jgi:copper(I)-binding protein
MISAFPPRTAALPRIAASLALALMGLVPAAARAEPPVSVSGPWFRYMLATVPAGGFMTVNNAADQPMVLTGASSQACGMVMLHKTVSSGGVERMVPVKEITVPARSTFRFAPGGYHLMCMQPHMHVGETVSVTLTFRDGSHLDASFPVHGPDFQPK